MTHRAAPTGGYDFGNKRQYRRTVWSQFRKFCGGQVAEKHALLMPSSEGDEIEVALANGFRQEHLHIVDENPAIVATLKRTRFSRIHTYGVTTARAIDRIRKEGIALTCANFDFTGPILTGAQERVIHASTLPEAFAPRNVLAITCLRGRDDPTMLGMAQAMYRESLRGVRRMCDAHPGMLQMRPYQMLDDTDETRLLYMTSWSGRFSVSAEDLEEFVPGWTIGTGKQHSLCFPFGIRASMYRSSNGQTMLCGFVERHRIPCGCPVCATPLPTLRSWPDRWEVLREAGAYQTTRGTIPATIRALRELPSRRGG